MKRVVSHDSLELRAAAVGSVMPATEVKIVSTHDGSTV